MIIIKSFYFLPKEKLEEYRKLFNKQKESGLIVLPVGFEALITEDEEIKVIANDGGGAQKYG